MNVQKPTVRSLTRRTSLLYGMVFIAFTSLIVKCGYLQITNGDSFRKQAQNAGASKIPVLPTRGRMYDTYGNLLAYDKPAYSVYLTKSSDATVKSYTPLMDKMSTILNVPAKKLMDIIDQNKYYAQIRLGTNLTDQQLAYIEEHLSELPGINVVAETQRIYPFGDLAGQVLGFTGKITKDNQKYYKDYLATQSVGVSGLESQYEKQLQGQVGYQLTSVSRSGGYLKTLGFSPPPVPGANLKLTLDGRLQAETQNIITDMVAKSKYQGEIEDAGAVAIDVKTGGVLAMVSYPYLDPNWYVDGSYTKHSHYLSTTTAQMNHTIQSPMAPGSTVKPANLLAALQHGVISPYYQMVDHMITYIGNAHLSDDGMSHGMVDPVKAIRVSCDTFFYELGLMMGKWAGYGGAKSYQSWLNTNFARGITMMFQGEWDFGLGQKTGIDLPGEVSGEFLVEDARQHMNSVQFNLAKAQASLKKTNQYPLYGSPVDLAFAGIGQSQQFTPIELAQYVAAIANNGKRLKPHLVEEVNPQDGSSPTAIQPQVQNVVQVKPEYMQLVQQGMYQVINSPDGTAYGVFTNDPYKAAGKTGTAEIMSHGKKVDNSVFIAYAPYDHPEIAVAVMVPGAGYGAETAVPIAEKMFNLYFQERHEFFPKSQWVDTKIPDSWTKSPAYTGPEAQN